MKMSVADIMGPYLLRLPLAMATSTDDIIDGITDHTMDDVTDDNIDVYVYGNRWSHSSDILGLTAACAELF